MKLPELLAPAGDLDKLKVAVAYGADAVYLSGRRFGLRAAAGNFTAEQMQAARDYTGDRGSKLYVTANIYPHAGDRDGLLEYFIFLERIGVDAVIVSDLGVAQLLKSSTKLPWHLSTQASCLNSRTAALWKSLGAERVILGRELSIAAAGAIRHAAQVPVEIFIHGALCITWAGTCSLSAYIGNRDANRGVCLQACRLAYHSDQPQADSPPEFPLSSKDLCGLELLPAVAAAGIDAVKIEGRMRSLLYLATTVRVYRQALDACAAGGFSAAQADHWREELNSVPHRDYCTASLAAPAAAESLYHSQQTPAANATHEMLGRICACNGSRIWVLLYQPLSPEQEVELLPLRGEPLSFKVQELSGLDGRKPERARPATIVTMTAPPQAAAGLMLRARHREPRHAV